jgi:hypothetical protein
MQHVVCRVWVQAILERPEHDETVFGFVKKEVPTHNA